jgi:acyl-CoA thioesterase I
MKRLALVCALLLVPALRSGTADPASYLAPLVREMDVTWPRNRAITIVCHGHSVPAGYFRTPVVDTFNAYPHLLHRALKEAHPHAVINVIVTAVGGEDSTAGAKRFAAEVLAHKPDVILIDYALNDRRPGLEAARAAWSDMIRQAKERHIPVILLTPTADQGDDWQRPNSPLAAHATQIRALAAEHGVGLADSTAAFQKAVADGKPLKDLMAQGNHPNRAGHDLVCAELMRWFAMN